MLNGGLSQVRISRSRVFKRRVLKGIPEACRGRVWYELLDSEAGGGAGKLRPTVESLFSKAVPESDQLIRVDLPRAIPFMRMFSQRNPEESMYRLLRAYSNADSEVGYLQGMAFFAALFLSYLDETRAFWAFWQFMQGSRHEFSKFYSQNFARLRELNRVWDALLEKKYPKVAKNLKRVQIDPMAYTSGWFLTGFQSMEFPAPLRLRIFDRQIGFGTRALLSFALTIVSIGKKQLEKGSAEDCLLWLMNPVRLGKFGDWKEVLKKCESHFLSTSKYREAFKRARVRDFL
jgi:hypothetical protein